MYDIWRTGLSCRHIFSSQGWLWLTNTRLFSKWTPFRAPGVVNSKTWAYSLNFFHVWSHLPCFSKFPPWMMSAVTWLCQKAVANTRAWHPLSCNRSGMKPNLSHFCWPDTHINTHTHTGRLTAMTSLLHWQCRHPAGWRFEITEHSTKET